MSPSELSYAISRSSVPGTGVLVSHVSLVGDPEGRLPVISPRKPVLIHISSPSGADADDANPHISVIQEIIEEPADHEEVIQVHDPRLDRHDSDHEVYAVQDVADQLAVDAGDVASDIRNICPLRPNQLSVIVPTHEHALQLNELRVPKSVEESDLDTINVHPEHVIQVPSDQVHDSDIQQEIEIGASADHVDDLEPDLEHDQEHELDNEADIGDDSSRASGASGGLSPSRLSQASAISGDNSMIDASEFRLGHHSHHHHHHHHSEPTYQTLTSVHASMSPPQGYSPNSSYATLTPLQPLPPISTMSDKFTYGHGGHVSGSFTLMQNNGMGMVHSPYTYDKLPSMGMSPSQLYSSPNNSLGSIGLHQDQSPLSPQSGYSHTDLQSPQKSLSPPNCDEGPYLSHAAHDPDAPELVHSPVSPTTSVSLQSPPPVPVSSSFGFNSVASLPCSINGLTTMTPNTVLTTAAHQPEQQTNAIVIACASPSTQLVALQSVQDPDEAQAQPISMTMPVASEVMVSDSDGDNLADTSEDDHGMGAKDMEEINTKELAQRISAELKRYSIPQAIFAQRVLCRSQGTLSDLLRNPKPWSKLKSGRETFRRMWKWLQEPEFQRMSALRLAAAQVPQRTTTRRKDDSPSGGHGDSPTAKKPRLVFTDLQRRTLQAIFKETKRPSKEMQVTIARQLGLEPTTVGNFFMNARRRSMDKWREDDPKALQQDDMGNLDDPPSPMSATMDDDNTPTLVTIVPGHLMQDVL